MDNQNTKSNGVTKKNKSALIILLAVDVLLIAISALQIVWPSLHFGNFALLNPAGIIARQERGLMFKAVLLMLIGAIPVYFLIFFFAWKYRASHVVLERPVASKPRADYSPNMDSNAVAGLIWLIPISIISVIAVINWKSTHALDPYKPIASEKKPITIQVVALQWKWLFIYPEQNIAAINFVEFPENTPVSFELTADAPMNSFWIPQLGGQMYAMPGMETHLNLMADKAGEYNGSAAEISGSGFAGMRFVAKSASDEDFNNWTKAVKQSPASLTSATYDELTKPSEDNNPAFYSSVQKDLYNDVMIKYMAPTSEIKVMDMQMPRRGNY